MPCRWTASFYFEERPDPSSKALAPSPPLPEFQCCNVADHWSWRSSLAFGAKQFQGVCTLPNNIEIRGKAGLATCRDKQAQHRVDYSNTVSRLFLPSIDPRCGCLFYWAVNLETSMRRSSTSSCCNQCARRWWGRRTYGCQEFRGQAFQRTFP